MPHEVLAKILLVAVSIVIVGLASTILLYYVGVGSVKADLLIEKIDLYNGGGILTVRNTGNIDVISIDRLLLECYPRSIELNPDTVPTPIPPGNMVTITFNTNIEDGEYCRIHIQATARGGYRIASTSTLTPVKHL